MIADQHIATAGSGLLDMFRQCAEAGLRPPTFRHDAGCFIQTLWRPAQGVTPEVVAQVTAQVAPEATGEVTVQDVRPETEAPVEALVEAPVELSATEINIITALTAESLGRSALLGRLGYSQRTGNFKKAIRNLLDNGWIELTIPDKPNSRLQKYRLTATGRARLANGDQP